MQSAKCKVQNGSWRRTLVGSACALLSLLVAACGDVGSGVANPPSNDTTKLAAAAIGSLFNQDADANIAASVKVAFTPNTCPNDPGCTCTSVAQNQQPTSVTTTAYRDAGTYGSAEAALTVDAGDFCTQPDGTANAGSGPDGAGRLASFLLIGDVNTDCTQASATSTVVMKAGSYGIWRNTEAESTGVAYQPQIFGNFTFSVNSTEVTYDCTIYLGGDERVLFAACADAAGTAISLESDADCRIGSGE